MTADAAARAPTQPAAFAWDDVLAFGLGVLRWTPDALWGATPREIAAAATAFMPARAQALERGDMAALMALFPDDQM